MTEAGVRVLEIAADLRYERGPRLGPDTVYPRVAIVAHFSTGPDISKSLSTYLGALVAAEYDIVVISASEIAGELRWPHGFPPRTTVLRRPNIGYDFGSWASVLHGYPKLAGAERVLLTNDSLVGPFTGIEAQLAASDSTDVDVFGLVRSEQIAEHLQSFFLCFRGGVLADRPLRRFWGDIRVHPDKMAVVMSHELGLSALLREHSYVTASLYPVGPANPLNPTVAGWHDLLQAGFPFVKRMLVAAEEFRTDGFEVTRRQIAEAVQELYGTDLEGWL